MEGREAVAIKLGARDLVTKTRSNCQVSHKRQSRKHSARNANTLATVQSEVTRKMNPGEVECEMTNWELRQKWKKRQQLQTIEKLMQRRKENSSCDSTPVDSSHVDTAPQMSGKSRLSSPETVQSLHGNHC